MDKIALEKVGPGDLSDCGIGCLTDPKNQGYQPKVEWLQRRFAEGLRLLLFRVRLRGSAPILSFSETSRGQRRRREARFIRFLRTRHDRLTGSEDLQELLDEGLGAGAGGRTTALSDK